jgi:N-acetylglucosamine-6-sulfatase
VGNSRYYNASIIDGSGEIGVRTDYGDDPATDYAPDLFFGRVFSFLEDHLKSHASEPFLAVLATPSCHGPFTPAEKYKGHFANGTAPRTPSYNHSNEDKQWLMRQLSPLTPSMAVSIDTQHNSRWETLLSVDDYVGKVIALVEASGQMDNTFFLYASDHGFQLGQHRLPGDKRHPCERNHPPCRGTVSRLFFPLATHPHCPPVSQSC